MLFGRTIVCVALPRGIRAKVRADELVDSVDPNVIRRIEGTFLVVLEKLA